MEVEWGSTATCCKEVGWKAAAGRLDPGRCMSGCLWFDSVPREYIFASFLCVRVPVDPESGPVSGYYPPAPTQSEVKFVRTRERTPRPVRAATAATIHWTSNRGAVHSSIRFDNSLQRAYLRNTSPTEPRRQVESRLIPHRLSRPLSTCPTGELRA